MYQNKKLSGLHPYIAITENEDVFGGNLHGRTTSLGEVHKTYLYLGLLE